jgi:hypothetical protein
MCIACKAETRCEHPLHNCSAIEGAYCLVCHHDSSLPTPARRKSSTRPVPGKNGPRMGAVLREVPSHQRGITPASRQSRRGFSFSPGIRLKPLPRSCPFGCWSVMLMAVGADAAGLVLARALDDLGIAVVTFMTVALTVLVHAWRTH